MEFSIKPKIKINAKIDYGSLQKADLIVDTDIHFSNKLTISSNGAGHLSSTKTILPSRKFIKVFVAGGVPIVISGEFGIKARIEGNVYGEMLLEKKFNLSFPDAKYGLKYRAVPQFSDS